MLFQNQVHWTFYPWNSLWRLHHRQKSRQYCIPEQAQPKVKQPLHAERFINSHYSGQLQILSEQSIMLCLNH